MPYTYQHYGGGFMPTKGDMTIAAQGIGGMLGQRSNPALLQQFLQNPEEWWNPKTDSFMDVWPGRFLERRLDTSYYDPTLTGLSRSDLGNIIFHGPNVEIDRQGQRKQLVDRKTQELIAAGVSPAIARSTAERMYPATGDVMVAGAPPVGREGGTASGGDTQLPTTGYYEEGGKVKTKSQKLADLIDLIGMERQRGAVPIMAHEGEFVLNRDATQALGPERLAQINEIAQMPHYQEGGFITRESVPSGGKWLATPEGAYFYVPNNSVRSWVEGGARIVDEPPNEAVAYNTMDSAESTTGPNDPQLSRLLRTVSHYVIPEEDRPGDLTPPEVEAPDALGPSPIDSTAQQLDTARIAETARQLEERENLSRLSGQPRPPDPTIAQRYAELLPESLQQATQIVPPTGSGGQALPPPSQSRASTTRLSAGPESIEIPPAEAPDIRMGSSRQTTPPMRVETPAATPTREQPQEVPQAGVSAPSVGYRQKHQGLGLDMNYLQNATPEQAMAYLYEVAQNRENPQLSWIERMQGQQESPLPATDMMFNQMLQQYTGIKSLPPALEEMEAQNRLTEARARESEVSANVAEETEDIRADLIRSQALAQDLENRWARDTYDGRRNMFDMSIQQAAIDNENYARLKDLEMENIDAATSYNLAQAAALSRTGSLNETIVLNPGDYADLYEAGQNMYDKQVDNLRGQVTALENAMQGDSWNNLSREQREAVQSEFFKASTMLSWLSDPTSMEQVTIDDFREQLRPKFQDEGRREEDWEEEMRRTFGFDEAEFLRMKEVVRNTAQLQNFPQTVMNQYASPYGGTSATNSIDVLMQSLGQLSEILGGPVSE